MTLALAWARHRCLPSPPRHLAAAAAAQAALCFSNPPQAWSKAPTVPAPPPPSSLPRSRHRPIFAHRPTFAFAPMTLISCPHRHSGAHTQRERQPQRHRTLHAAGAPRSPCPPAACCIFTRSSAASASLQPFSQAVACPFTLHLISHASLQRGMGDRARQISMERDGSGVERQHELLTNIRGKQHVTRHASRVTRP